MAALTLKEPVIQIVDQKTENVGGFGETVLSGEFKSWFVKKLVPYIQLLIEKFFACC